MTKNNRSADRSYCYSRIKGFMSVLLQETTNPALDPALRSRYVPRNCFMIAKHFCSLVSRCGFHFSMVEAPVSDRCSENCTSFRFKGRGGGLPAAGAPGVVPRRSDPARAVAG